MFVLEELQSRKRQRPSQESVDLEQEREPVAKKQKSTSESGAHPRHRPPSFWNTLSKVRLSRAALREFDRRNKQETGQPCSNPITNVEYPQGGSRQRLKRSARRGGPDLSHLRGVRRSHAEVDLWTDRRL